MPEVVKKEKSEVLIQRALQMSGPSLLAFVKNDGLSRAELKIVIDDLAAAKRAKGQTRKQAHNEFITRDELGVELYRHFVAVKSRGL